MLVLGLLLGLVIGMFLGATAASVAIARYEEETDRQVEQMFARSTEGREIDVPVPPAHARTHR